MAAFPFDSMYLRSVYLWKQQLSFKTLKPSFSQNFIAVDYGEVSSIIDRNQKRSRGYFRFQPIPANSSQFQKITTVLLTMNLSIKSLSNHTEIRRRHFFHPWMRGTYAWFRTKCSNSINLFCIELERIKWIELNWILCSKSLFNNSPFNSAQYSFNQCWTVR